MQLDFKKFKQSLYKNHYHPYESDFTKQRNSISCSAAKNLKLLHEQGKINVANEKGFDSTRGHQRLGKSKDALDMINVEKVIFKEEFYS